ncbi:hypothetical protein ElyMa_000075900 [Elysia marginata]|uniref:Uncharacterized protein n=1 Tax=Elysia marginata TaxID=1093978 RepID=A0AAV4EIL5_9GAST|nr:hypothetical protein ElyMa_000075900 [Elysia marginata]
MGCRKVSTNGQLDSRCRFYLPWCVFVATIVREKANKRKKRGADRGTDLRPDRHADSRTDKLARGRMDISTAERQTYRLKDSRLGRQTYRHTDFGKEDL